MSNYKALVDYFRACEQERSAARAKYERECKAALSELDATLWIWFGCASQTLLDVDGAADPKGLYRGSATLKFGAHSLNATFSLPAVGGAAAVRVDGRDEFATLIAERLAYAPPVDFTPPRPVRIEPWTPSVTADES